MSHIHIDVTNLSYSYNKNTEVLKNINFSAHENDSIGIIGGNGVGKSTLLKLLVGLDLNFKGDIRVEEIPLENNTVNKIREKVGYVFQDAENQLFMTTVEQDVGFAPRNYGLSEKEVQLRIQNALKKVGIENLAKRKITELSGGEKKLVSIATILSMPSDIILMDEPSSTLDPKNRRNLINILNSFDHLKIITSHDLDFVWETCNRVLLMNEGKIIADGEVKEILQNKSLLEQNNLELPLRFQN